MGALARLYRRCDGWIFAFFIELEQASSSHEDSHASLLVDFAAKKDMRRYGALTGLQ